MEPYCKVLPIILICGLAVHKKFIVLLLMLKTVPCRTVILVFLSA